MGNIQADLTLQVTVAKVSTPTTNFISEALALADQAYDESHSSYEEVANGATDQAISLGGLTTAQVVYIASDQTVSFKINGSIAIVAKQVFLIGAAVTSLSVSNASGSQANLDVVLLGT